MPPPDDAGRPTSRCRRPSAVPADRAWLRPRAAASHAPINWWVVATVVYACVAGLLLLRLAIGLCLTWRLARAAKPVDEPWMIDPTCASAATSAVPSPSARPSWCRRSFADGTRRKRLAVLAHEGAHVANRDFYVLLLASLNRAVFWFSPFSWWQLARLAELAEIISDAQAIEVIDDRLSYAEILLEFVQRDAAADGARDGAGLDRARARRAHHRRRRHARRGRLAQAAVDRGRDRACRDRARPA